MDIQLQPETKSEVKKYERWSKHKTPKLLSSSEFTCNYQRALITFDGETRELWCSVWQCGEETRYTTPNVFASMTRYGNKVHQEHIMFHIVNDKARIYNSVALNRQAHIIGWWKSEYETNGLASQHVGG